MAASRRREMSADTSDGKCYLLITMFIKYDDVFLDSWIVEVVTHCAIQQICHLDGVMCYSDQPPSVRSFLRRKYSLRTVSMASGPVLE